MAKYVCKAYGVEAKFSSTLFVETEKSPRELLFFLSENAAKKINEIYISYDFYIPDISEMNSCDLYTNDKEAHIELETMTDKEYITIEKVDGYIEID